YNAISKNMATSFSNKDLIKLLADAGKYKIRTETNNDYGNGFPYHAVEYKPRGISCQISKTPREDVVLLHYNLFNNGVLPQELLDLSTTSPSATNNATAKPSTSSEDKGYGYQYKPSATVDLITRYIQSCYDSAY
ncbi:MAG: hypothetical protein IJ272_03590, partial [Clostridia bacterium]|nr:hypothetical protein [Clostridia bacterium]